LKTAGVIDHAALAVSFYSGGTHLSYLVDDASLSGSQGFTKLSMRVVAPAGASGLRVEYRLYGAGTLWADNASVTQA
jgi:hypothetical protein